MLRMMKLLGYRLINARRNSADTSIYQVVRLRVSYTYVLTNIITTYQTTTFNNNIELLILLISYVLYLRNI